MGENNLNWFIQMLKMAEDVHKYGNEQLTKIDEEKIKMENSISKNKDLISQHIKSTIRSIAFWEVLFNLELMDTVEKQLDNLPRREELEEKVKMLGRTIQNAKTDRNSNQDILKYAQIIQPLIEELKQVKISALKEVSFTPKETYPKFIKTSKERFNSGFISTSLVDLNSLHLLPNSNFLANEEAKFAIHISDATPSEEILELLQCEVHSFDQNITENISVNSKKYGIEITFPLKEEISSYTLNVCLFNQNIHGSPFTFLSKKSNQAETSFKIFSPTGVSCDSSYNFTMESPSDALTRQYQLIKQEVMSSTPIRSDESTDNSNLDDSLRSRRLLKFGSSYNQRLPRKTQDEPIPIKEENQSCMNISIKSNYDPIDMEEKPKYEPIDMEESLISQMDECSLLEKPSVNKSLNPISQEEQIGAANTHGQVKDINQNDMKSGYGDSLSATCVRVIKPNLDKFQNPIGVAELLSGDIVVADTSNDRLVIYSPDGKMLRKTNSNPPNKRPSAIVVLKDGRFAVIFTRDIGLFHQNGDFAKIIAKSKLNRPFGLALDKDENLVTMEIAPEVTITKINIATDKVISRVPLILELPEHIRRKAKPYFITFHSFQILIVVDLGLDTVYMVDYISGAILHKLGSTGKGDAEFIDPSGVVCDSNGYIFVGDSKNHRIQIFKPSGEFMCVLKTDRPLRRPSGLCLTNNGHIIIANYWENSVAKYKLRFD